jgi:hypothetical protein
VAESFLTPVGTSELPHGDYAKRLPSSIKEGYRRNLGRAMIHDVTAFRGQLMRNRGVFSQRRVTIIVSIKENADPKPVNAAPFNYFMSGPPPSSTSDEYGFIRRGQGDG